jgi:hypothetical protein
MNTFLLKSNDNGIITVIISIITIIIIAIALYCILLLLLQLLTVNVENAPIGEIIITSALLYFNFN